MSIPFANAFAGRSVFVTGHTGFKGSWLCLWLARLGARVTGYALAPPTEPNSFAVSGIRDLLSGHHEADIRDEATLQAAMRDAQPDVVLHLAAQSIVRKSYKVPRETFDVNVMGTASVLDAVGRLDRPCAVVAVTSDKCYENREQVWGYRESDPMGETDPYGASKGAAELVIRSYRAINIDLQKVVHEDMSRYFGLYPNNWGLRRPDTNIDHRRVPNLQTFFRRHGKNLPMTSDPADFRPGDLVTWMLPGNLPHIGIISDGFSRDGKRPLVVHNIGEGPRCEDVLFAYKLDGHFRYFKDNSGD